MTEQTTLIDTLGSKILNLDAIDTHEYIAYADDGKVIAQDKQIKIKPIFKYPIIRRLTDDRFLVLDARSDEGNNAVIYDFYGNLIQKFLAGDGIQDVIVHFDKIIISYFDEGVCGNEGPNNDGLAVFDFSGKQVYGFNSSTNSGQILDCYCLCKHGANKVLFYPYDEFKVYELDLATLEVVSFKTPKEFKGASAMSSVEDNIIFHSSYDHKSSFFLWNRENNKVTQFGRCAPGLKGLLSGKFLRYGEHGFTIIDPLNEVEKATEMQ